MASILAGLIGSGTVGSVLVRVGADTSALAAGLAKAEGQTSAAAAKMSSIGGTLTKGLTIPIVAIGAVATKMALDFEEAFVRIASVTNTSSDQIEGMKESVLELAQETARAPEELANALYFLSSSGLNAQQQMETLELSAKAAAVGLGTTDEIARVTSQALNAYADAGLTAAEVTDTLVAAVREGTATPSEFADALGRILPIAAAAGVTFDEVAASLSVLSNIGLDVNEGVTAMRGLLQAIVAPGTQAANAMADLGISAEQMRQVLSEGGLLAAMQLLMDKSGGNLDVLRDIIPNVRSLTGELGIMGQDAEKTAGIFERVGNATGDLGVAFEKTAAGPGFDLKQSFAELQVAMIKFGNVLIPIATSAAGTLSGIAKAFSSLPGPAQATVVQVLLLGAALGPLLKLSGNLILVFGRLFGVLSSAGSAISLLSTRIGIATGAATTMGAALTTAGIAAGIALIAYGMANAAAEAAQFRAAVSKLTEQLLHSSTALETYRAQMDLIVASYEGSSFQAAFAAKGAEIEALARGEAEKAVRGQIAVLDVLPNSYSAVTEHVVEGMIAQDDYAGALEHVKGQIDETKAALTAASAEFNANRDAVDAAKRAIQDLTGAAHGVLAAEDGLKPAIEEVTGAIGEQANTVRDDAQAHRDLRNAQLELVGGFLGVQAAVLSAEDAHFRLIEAQRAVNELTNDGKQGTLEYKQAVNDLAQAQLGAAQAELSLNQAALDYVQTLSGELAPSQQTVIGLVREFGEKANLTKGQVDKLIASVLAETQALRGIPGDGGTNMPSIRAGIQGITTKAGLATQAIAGTHRELGLLPSDGQTKMPSARTGLAGIAAQASTAAAKVAAVKNALLGLDGTNVSASILVHISQIIGAQHGFHGVVTEPTIFVAGEGGHPEWVDVTPMHEMNQAPKTSGGAFKGGSTAGGSTSVPPSTIQHHYHLAANFHAPIYTDGPTALAQQLAPDLDRELHMLRLRRGTSVGVR